MSEKPSLDKVTLVPDQSLTKQEEQECISYLLNYEPRIIWEVGQKVTAYLGTKIINLYIRSTEPRNTFIGYLAEDGEIHIAEHQTIGEPATSDKETSRSPTFSRPRVKEGFRWIDIHVFDEKNEKVFEAAGKISLKTAHKFIQSVGFDFVPHEPIIAMPLRKYSCGYYENCMDYPKKCLDCAEVTAESYFKPKEKNILGVT